MKYTVAWTPAAEQELAALWMAAPDRAAVTTAANHIDAMLKRDPFRESESRYGNTRVMFALPLGVYFDVEEADNLVTVWGVWQRSRPS